MDDTQPGEEQMCEPVHIPMHGVGTCFSRLETFRCGADAAELFICARLLDELAHDDLLCVIQNGLPRLEEFVKGLVETTRSIQNFDWMHDSVLMEESRVIVELAADYGIDRDYALHFVQELHRAAEEQNALLIKLRKNSRKWYKRFLGGKKKLAAKRGAKVQPGGSAPPMVSVIIPVFKVEPYVDVCLECLLQQTLQEMEFIFIDDCGGDASMDKIVARARLDPRIVILRNDANKGAGFSRNIGIQHARGKYVAFFDADDFCDSDFYERLFRLAERNNALISKGVCVNVFDDGRHVPGRLNDAMRRDFKRNKFDLYAIFLYEHVSAIYRRDWVLTSGAAFGFTKQGEDTYFLLQVCQGVGRGIALCDDVRYYYRQHDDSSSHHRNLAFYMAQVDSKMEKLEYLNAHGLSGPSYLRYCSILLDFLAHHYWMELFALPEGRAVLDVYLERVLEFATQIQNRGELAAYVTCPGSLVVLSMLDDAPCTGTTCTRRYMETLSAMMSTSRREVAAFDARL